MRRGERGGCADAEGRLAYHDPFGGRRLPEVGREEVEEGNFESVKLCEDNLLDIASKREADLGAGWRVG